jgi:hypothetical protein
MTKQQIFNKVWQYAITENHPLSFEAGSHICRYRSPEGNKCWIGCLIPDEIYEPEMDDPSDNSCSSIANIRPRHKSLGLLFRNIRTFFLSELQAGHDGIVSHLSGNNYSDQELLDKKKRALAIIARDFRLIIPKDVKGEMNDATPSI